MTQGAAGYNILSNQISQNVVGDDLNSTTNNLNANTSFVGVASSTLGVAAIQYMLYTDQHAHVYIDQSGVGLLDGFGTANTNGTTALVGTNTKFTRDFIVGDQIYVSGETARLITAIISDTALTVDTAFSTTANDLTFQQYFWDIKDQFYCNDSKAIGDTVTAVGAYYRARVHNISPTTATTFLRFSIALCPINPAVPRALSDEGTIKTSVYEISDEYGHSTTITPIGTLRTSGTFRLVGKQFGSGPDTTYWTTANTGANAVSTIASGVCTLTSGTSNTGNARLTSVVTGRYIPGVPNQYRSLHRVTQDNVNKNVRRWGAFNVVNGDQPSDGYYFELQGGELYCVTRAANTITSNTASGNWSGTPDFFTMDTSVHSYGIIWSTREAEFYIDDRLVHKASNTTNRLTTTNSLYINTTNSNFEANGNSSGTIECWFAGIYRLGDATSESTWKNIRGVNAGTQLKTGPGTLKYVIINSANTGAVASTTTIYDGLSNTNPIATISLQGTTQQNQPPASMPYNLPFYNGLYVVQTSAGIDVTYVFE